MRRNRKLTSTRSAGEAQKAKHRNVFKSRRRLFWTLVTSSFITYKWCQLPGLGAPHLQTEKAGPKELWSDSLLASVTRDSGHQRVRKHNCKKTLVTTDFHTRTRSGWFLQQRWWMTLCSGCSIRQWKGYSYFLRSPRQKSGRSGIWNPHLLKTSKQNPLNKLKKSKLPRMPNLGHGGNFPP